MLNTFFHFEPREAHYHREVYEMILKTIDKPGIEPAKLNILMGLLEDVLTSFKDMNSNFNK